MSNNDKCFFKNEGKMNTKTAIAALALLLPVSAIAESTPHEVCTLFSEYAEMFMKVRQDGLPMHEVMDIAARRLGDVPAWDSAAETLIIDAYSHPRYSTERVKQSTIGDFADSAYLSCITNVR